MKPTINETLTLAEAVLSEHPHSAWEKRGGVLYPKGAWEQLVAVMICAGHTPELRLTRTYLHHICKCEVCGQDYYVFGKGHCEDTTGQSPNVASYPFDEFVTPCKGKGIDRMDRYGH